MKILLDGKHLADNKCVKILFIDIETSPNLAYVWQCYDANVAPSQLVKTTNILCWAAKWLGSKEILFDWAMNDLDDSRICESMWKLFDEADIVVAHNSIGFDVPTLCTRWLKMGLPPPSPYKVIDTLKLARSIFRFQINKLDHIARYLGVGKKTEHEGFDLWVKCMAGVRSAWKRMKKYNINDTLLLEQVYLKLRAWDKIHPNVGLMMNDVPRCVVCGSTKIKVLPKKSWTSVRGYQAARCMNCGKVMRSGKSIVNGNLRNAT